jgi:hypothetical protein
MDDAPYEPPGEDVAEEHSLPPDDDPWSGWQDLGDPVG